MVETYKYFNVRPLISIDTHFLFVKPDKLHRAHPARHIYAHNHAHAMTHFFLFDLSPSRVNLSRLKHSRGNAHSIIAGLFPIREHITR